MKASSRLGLNKREEKIMERIKTYDFSLSKKEISLVLRKKYCDVDFLRHLALYCLRRPEGGVSWPARAILCLQNAVEFGPKNSLNYLLLAITYFKAGRLQEAIETLKKEIVSFDIGGRVFYEKVFYLVDSMISFGKGKQAYRVLENYTWEYQRLLKKMKQDGVIAYEFVNYL